MTIFNNTTLRLSFGDAVRVLFGRTITLRTEIDVAAETQVQATRQVVRVAPLLKRKEKAGPTMQAAACA